MTHTVIGFFRDASDARKAADALMREGFDERHIDFASGTGNRDDRDYDDERSGKIGDFFKSLFSDNDYEKERYSHAARENSLLSVYVDNVNEAERAADILDHHGAIEVNEPYSSGVSSDNYQRSTSDTSRPFRSGVDDTSESIPIIEEDVNIGKREVRRDRVRVRSRIVDRPVEETLRLREETIHVERTPADRDATDAELNDLRDETIEVEAYGEEPMVSRRSRVVEEVKVGKKVHERQERVQESKRKTEVDIDHDVTDDERSADERTRNERSTDYE
jgi:uncharacterized protein (TIGR02271 family)